MSITLMLFAFLQKEMPIDLMNPNNIFSIQLVLLRHIFVAEFVFHMIIGACMLGVWNSMATTPMGILDALCSIMDECGQGLL